MESDVNVCATHCARDGVNTHDRTATSLWQGPNDHPLLGEDRHTTTIHCDRYGIPLLH